MICVGDRVRVSKMLIPCFLAVEMEMTDLMSAKTCAPLRVQKVPEIFIRSFIMRRSCSAWLLVFGLVVGEWDREVCDEPQDFIAVITQAEEQVVAWPPDFSAAGAGAFGQRGLAFVEGGPLGEDRHDEVVSEIRTSS